MLKLFFVMLLFSFLDDFVSQPVCLSNLKQKSFWKDAGDMYKHDYIISLIVHSIMWASMMNLPLLLDMFNDFVVSGTFCCCSIMLNAIVHCLIDNLKCNDKTINLIEDQILHFIQIVITFISVIIYTSF